MNRRFYVLCVLFSLLCTGWRAGAEEVALVSFVTAEGSHIEVSGTSTLHDWEVTTTVLEGELQVPADLVAQDDWATWLAAHPGPLPIKAQLSIPVNSLKSGKDGMDKVTWKTLKQSDYPEITYRMDEVVAAAGGKPEASEEAEEAEEAAANGVGLVTEGVLAAAGAERSLSAEMSFEPQEDGTIVVSGQAKMKISDFQIDPPKAMLGVIKTGDDIEITYRWQVEKQDN